MLYIGVESKLYSILIKFIDSINNNTLQDYKGQIFIIGKMKLN
jgi:hypothetical protein